MLHRCWAFFLVAVLEKAIGYGIDYFGKVDLVLLDYGTRVSRIAFEL